MISSTPRPGSAFSFNLTDISPLTAAPPFSANFSAAHAISPTVQKEKAFLDSAF
jgi:hypothetical protein